MLVQKNDIDCAITTRIHPFVIALLGKQRQRLLLDTERGQSLSFVGFRPEHGGLTTEGGQ